MNSRLLLALFICPAALHAAPLDFYRDVYPFLKSNCISCHNKTTAKAGLNMETPELMIQGGDSGPSLVPGKSGESLVVLASLHQNDMEMPPANNKSGAQNLTPEELAILKRWVDEGARSSVQQERTVVLQKFARAADPIYCVAVTQDGRYAACGRANQIYLYDLATRQLVGTVNDPAEKDRAAHRAMVQSLAFSPDGTRLASGSFREVKVWELSAPAATPAVSNSAVMPAQASADTLQKIAKAAKMAVLTHALSPDCKRVVTGFADGSVRVWEAATAKPFLDLRGSVSARQKMARLERDIAAQVLEQAFFNAESARYTAQNKALDILLGKAKEAIVTMGKVLPEKQKAVPPATDARAAAQKVAEGLRTKLAEDKKPATEQELKTAEDKIITAKMAEASALAAVSAAENNIKDAEDDLKRITVSKAQNDKAIASAHAAVAASKAVQTRAAAELQAFKQSLTKPGPAPVSVGFSADGQRVAASLADGSVHVWATASGTPVGESRDTEKTTTTALTPASDGGFVATKTVTQKVDGAPHWKLSKKLQAPGLFADRVNALCFSPNGKSLATGGGELSRSGEIKVFNVATGEATHTWREAHADAVLCLDFSPDGQWLASGAADKMARVTALSSGKQVHLFEGHTHYVTGVAFRSDGRVLATAGAEGSVVTWNMLMGERKKKIEGWTKEVTSLQFIGATNQIVTSSGDNRIRIITDEGAEVRSMAGLPDYMQSVASDLNGGVIIAGGEDSQLRLWNDAGKELAAFGSAPAPRP